MRKAKSLDENGFYESGVWSVVAFFAYNKPMKSFVRLIALVLAFWLPVSGLASIQTVCEHPAMEKAGVSLVADGVQQADMSMCGEPEHNGSKLTDFKSSSFGACDDGGHQCPTAILPASLAVSEPTAITPLFIYENSLVRVFLEQPQRPPLLA
jgi:hypothetical protein